MLNLRWLRESVLQAASTGDADQQEPLPIFAHPFSRRSLLQAGVASSSVLPAAALALQRSADIAAYSRDGRFTLQYGGATLWTVDPAWFDGDARLTHSIAPDSFTVSLSGASFTGTGLRCDFTMSCKQHGGNWSAEFTFPTLDGRACVDLASWLRGDTVVMTRVRVPASMGGCGGLASRIAGQAVLSFSSAWTLTLDGASIVAVRTARGSAACESVSLSLPKTSLDSLITEPVLRRSHVAFDGAQAGALMPSTERVAIVSKAGSRMTAEFARLSNDRLLVAALFSPQTSSHAGAASAVVDSSSEGGGLQLPVEDFRVVELHGAAEQSKALFARLRQGTQWASAGSASAEVTVGSQSSLETSSKCTGLNAPLCELRMAELAVSRLYIPFVGADVAYFAKRPPSGKKPPDSLEVIRHDNLSFFSDGVIDLNDFDLIVRRTVDGFGAVFRFKGMRLAARHGQWTLARSAGANDACEIEFELPSQHLNEEAIFSASRPGLSDASQEVLCAPVDSAQTRVLNYIARESMKPWNATPPAVKAFLESFVVRLIRDASAMKQSVGESAGLTFLNNVKAGIANAKDLPRAFAKYLSPQYAQATFDVFQALDSTKQDAIRQAAAIGDEPGKDVFSTWRPRAVDSAPSRLVFSVDLKSGEHIPFSLRALMAWSEDSDEGKLAGARFTEKLSTRAIPPTAPLEVQENLATETGRPLIGIHQLSAKGGGERVTALELPYRLAISPIRREAVGGKPPPAYWRASSPPQEVWGKSISLWHLRAGKPGGPPLQLRALSSPDFDLRKNAFLSPPAPYLANAGEIRASLDRHDRFNFVALSGGFGQTALLGSASVVPRTSVKDGEGLFIPQPIQAKRLILTTPGATFDFDSRWDPPGGKNGALTVSKWEHHARIRRDSTVTVEYRGFLMPLGIPAVFIKRTTREFKRDGAGKESYRAVLVQRYSIRVDAVEMSYPALDQPFDSRDWFMRKLRVMPLETPPLLPPEQTADSQIESGTGQSFGRQAFWPMIPASPLSVSCSDGKLFEFTVENDTIAFKAPLVFVDNQIAHTPERLAVVIRAYATQVIARKGDFSAVGDGTLPVKKALARITKGELEYLPGAGSRNSRHITRWFALGIGLPTGTLSGAANSVLADLDEAASTLSSTDKLTFNPERERKKQPPFYPRLSQALIESELLSRLSGSGVRRNRIDYHPVFIRAAFDETENKGGVFARFIDGGATMSFGGNTSQSGGAFSPSTTMMALTRDHGPVGGATPSSNRPPVDILASPRTALQSASASPTSDPVAKFMKGLSDPVEYFCQAMGNAKLLGCVRLVDIVKTALQVTGTQVPRINQREIFDGVIDAIRPVLLDASGGPVRVLQDVLDALAKPDMSAEVAAKLAPPLQAAVGALESARAELQQASPRPEVVGAFVADAYAALRAFLDDANNLANNPLALLPPAAAATFAQLRSIHEQLLAARQALRDLPEQLKAGALALLAEEVRKVEARAVASPEFHAVLDWVLMMKAELARIEKAARDRAWAEISPALGALAGPVAELRGWLAFCRAASDNFRRQLHDAIAILLKPLVDTKAPVGPAIDNALEGLSFIQKSVETVLLKLRGNEAATRTATDALHAIVQLREILLTFAPMFKRIEDALAKTDIAVDIALSSEYLLKFEAMLRKTGELIGLLTQVEPMQVRSKLVKFTSTTMLPGNALVDYLASTLADTFAALKLVPALRDAAKAIGDLDIKVDGKPAAFKTRTVEVLRNTADQIEELNKKESLKEKLGNISDAWVEGVEKQLTAMLSSAMPQAAALMAAVVEWERQVAAAKDALISATKPVCTILAQWKKPVIGPDESAWISPDLLSRLDKLDILIVKAQGSCKSPATFDEATRAASDAARIGDEVTALAGYLGEKITGGGLGDLVNMKALVEQAIAKIGLPTKLRVSYEWRCNIDDFPRGGAAVFRPVKGAGTGPGGHPQLSISSVTEVDLRNPGAPVTRVNGTIDQFDVNLFGSASFLIIKFAPVTFTAGNSSSLKFDIEIREVLFGQALNFVNDLAKYVGAEAGVYVQALQGRPGLEIGYRFNRDVIQLAALTLQNVSFSIAVQLPFDNSPVRFKVAVGTRQKPVLASVGIYGGGFFVALTMRADTMELLEVSFEYGGVTGCEFGVAKGTCKITAGIYLALGVRDEITGFFSASGAFTIAQLMRVGAALLVSLKKEKSSLVGTATYTFSFSIGFAEYSYSVGVSYAKGGSSDMDTSADGTKTPPESQGQAIVNNQVTDIEYRMLNTAEPDSKSLQPSLRNRKAASKESERADYNLDIEEAASTPQKPAPLQRGLADAAVWSTYWSAFSDLDGAIDDELCPETKNSKTTS